MNTTDRIYFDNAATTPLDADVLAAMMPYLTTHFGNPSSIYSYGRESRLAIEQARKTVAKILNARPAEIFFTSGGTESSNTAINAAVNNLSCTHIITSRIEHHATLHTVQALQKEKNIGVSYVKLLSNGHIDLDHLEQLLKTTPEKCLVTLMHANNETGNLSDIHAIGNLCKTYNAVFHSDTVQTVGHLPFDLRHTPVDFITGAAHKFHGPKGVGMLYINENIKIHPFINGGSQERNMRAGTENVYGIAGFAKALQTASDNYEKDSTNISDLRLYMADCLLKEIPAVSLNGDALGNTLYTILNIALPRTDKTEMLLFNLDIHHICASGGSACTSGASQGSHVIAAVYPGKDVVAVRFSFSKHNTKEEVDKTVGILKTLL